MEPRKCNETVLFTASDAGGSLPSSTTPPPPPNSLATSNGLPRKTNKAQLGREFGKLVQPTVVVPSSSAYLIDGMSLIQKLQVYHLTFGEIAEMALSRDLRDGEGSIRIDVVFDVYRDLSIKSVKGRLKSEGDSITFKNLSSGQKVKQFRSFLQNGQNRTRIIKFVVDLWINPSCRSKLQHKTLMLHVGSGATR